MEVLALFGALFVVLPVVLGRVIPHDFAARGVWLLLGGVMAYLQSRTESLGGAWVVIAILVVFGFGFVEWGISMRARHAREH
jgi:hypothetical protein